jgi:hypothetical protein
VLYEGDVLSAWYMRYVLTREVDRAMRYLRPLAVLVATPQLLPGEHLRADAYETAVGAAAMAARSSDYLGSAGSGGLMIIMPEASSSGAQVAGRRWRDEMYRCSRGLGGVKWVVECYADVHDITAMRDLLDAEQAGAA